MSLSYGTLSPYKLYDAINAIIAGGAARTRIIFDGEPVNGDTITINSNVYTISYPFVNSGNNIYVGEGDELSTDNLVAALTGGAGSGTAYSSAISTDSDITSSVISDTEALIKVTSVGPNNVHSLSTTGEDIIISDTDLVGGRAASSIVALLRSSDSFYPLHLPQDETGTSLVYSLVTETGHDTKGGVSTFNKYRVQFDCYAKTHEAALTLSAAVKYTFDNFSGVFYRYSNNYLLNIPEVRYVSTTESPFNHKLELYQVSIDFNFYLKETSLTQTVTYATDRVVSDGLQLWYKANYWGQVGIGSGAAIFSSSGYIDCGNASTLDLTASISVAAWVKFDSYATDETILYKFKTPTGYKLIKDSTDIIFQIDTQTSCSFAHSGMKTNKWYHLAATYDGTTAKIYLDGVLKDSETYTAPSAAAANLYIGADNPGAGGTDYFTGALSMVRIWNTGLTVDQVQSTAIRKYAYLSTTETEYLISSWELSDVSGTDAPDAHGTNEGTIN